MYHFHPVFHFLSWKTNSYTTRLTDERFFFKWILVFHIFPKEEDATNNRRRNDQRPTFYFKKLEIFTQEYIILKKRTDRYTVWFCLELRERKNPPSFCFDFKWADAIGKPITFLSTHFKARAWILDFKAGIQRHHIRRWRQLQ